VVFSPDSNSLASSSEDHSVRLWDIASGESRILQGHTNSVCALAFSPDGHTLASASNDHTMRLWNLREHGASRLIQISGLENSHHIVFSADGKEIAVTTGGNAIGVFSAETGRFLRALRGHEAVVRRSALSPDGRTFATPSDDRTVRLWDLKTGESRVLLGHTDAVKDVTFSPDGKFVASISADKTVRLWTDDLPKDPAGFRSWLNSATPESIDIGRHPPPTTSP
jgi:WD40 repeat protein